jgi:hypothetical protein
MSIKGQTREPIVTEVIIPKEVIVEKWIEIPIEVIREIFVEKVVEIPVEVIKELQVEVIKEVLVDRVVEKIVEIPVEVIREVIREKDRPIIETLSKSLQTEKIEPEIIIKEIPIEIIKEVIKEAPRPAPKIVISVDTQTYTEPPKIEHDTSNLTTINLITAKKIQKINLSYKTIDFAYQGIQSPRTGNNSFLDVNGGGSPEADKLERRIKIYQDKNIELMMEIDRLKNQSTGLYSKLNEKQFETSGSHMKIIEQVYTHIIEAEKRKL